MTKLLSTGILIFRSNAGQQSMFVKVPGCEMEIQLSESQVLELARGLNASVSSIAARNAKNDRT